MATRTCTVGAVAIALALVAAEALPAVAWAQQPSPPSTSAGPAPPVPPPDPNRPPITPGELTRLFDAYAVLQAQNFLELTDEQYGEFVVALKTLQDIRRRHVGERNRLINDLRKLTAPEAPAPDATIQATFDELTREDTSAQADMAKAYETLDAVLDLRQRARFRVFEEQIERQKLNLLSRVRRKAVQRQK